MILLYKVAQSFRHNREGWLEPGRLVACRPEYARSFLSAKKIVRVLLAYSDKDIDAATFIDDFEFKPKKKEAVTIKEPEKETIQKKPVRKRRTKAQMQASKEKANE